MITYLLGMACVALTACTVVVCFMAYGAVCEILRELR